MGTVGTAKGVGRLALQLIVNGFEVAVGQHHVAVEHYDIVASGALYAVVAALSRT